MRTVTYQLSASDSLGRICVLVKQNEVRRFLFSEEAAGSPTAETLHQHHPERESTMLMEILWVSLVLGGLIASLWYQPTWRQTWRDLWLRLARPRALARKVAAVWRPSSHSRTDPGRLGPWPGPVEVMTRPGPSPRSVPHGCGIPSALRPNSKSETRNPKQIRKRQ
jgi:hypothetical protein